MLFRSMFFREAVGAQLTLKYDDGKTIYEGCLQKLDEALSYFDKEQPRGCSFAGGCRLVPAWSAPAAHLHPAPCLFAAEQGQGPAPVAFSFSVLLLDKAPKRVIQPVLRHPARGVLAAGDQP